jgi:hypothetical protein
MHAVAACLIERSEQEHSDTNRLFLETPCIPCGIPRDAVKAAESPSGIRLLLADLIVEGSAISSCILSSDNVDFLAVT